MLNLVRLKDRLEELDLSPNAASSAAGLGRDYVRDLLRGHVKEPSAVKLRALAGALRCTADYLTDNSGGGMNVVKGVEGVLELPISHRIRPGFFESDIGKIDKIQTWVVSDADIVLANQWLELLVGPSYWPDLRPGSLLHVIFENYHLEHGSIYVFTRRPLGSKLIERSARRVVFGRSDVLTILDDGSVSIPPAFESNLWEESALLGDDIYNMAIEGRVIATYHYLSPGMGPPLDALRA